MLNNPNKPESGAESTGLNEAQEALLTYRLGEVLRKLILFVPPHEAYMSISTVFLSYFLLKWDEISPKQKEDCQLVMEFLHEVHELLYPNEEEENKEEGGQE
jgi:hypothetical protein